MKPPKEIPRQAAIPKKGTPYIWDGKEVYLYHVRNPMLYIISTDAKFESAKDMYEVHPDDLPLVRKKGTAIKANPKAKTAEEKEWQDQVDFFFIRAAYRGTRFCENCSQPLNCVTLEDWRCVTAHILPKSRNSGFPEVAMNDDNKMYLGTNCGCHHRWDNAKASERAEMACYIWAMGRYQKFKELLTGPKRIKAEKYLNITQR